MGRIYNELSVVTITINPFDTNGDPHTPTTARYRLDDCLTKEQLIDWTDIPTPSTSMQVIIPSVNNAIIGERRNPEPKVMTVNTDKGLVTEHFGEYIYRIRDLKFAEVA